MFLHIFSCFSLVSLSLITVGLVSESVLVMHRGLTIDRHFTLCLMACHRLLWRHRGDTTCHDRLWCKTCWKHVVLFLPMTFVWRLCSEFFVWFLYMVCFGRDRFLELRAIWGGLQMRCRLFFTTFLHVCKSCEWLWIVMALLHGRNLLLGDRGWHSGLLLTLQLRVHICSSIFTLSERWWYSHFAINVRMMLVLKQCFWGRRDLGFQILRRKYGLLALNRIDRSVVKLDGSWILLRA